MASLGNTCLDLLAGGDGALAAPQSMTKATSGENDQHSRSSLNAAHGDLIDITSKPIAVDALNFNKNSGNMDLCTETRTVPMAPPADDTPPSKARSNTAAVGTVNRQSLHDEAQGLIDELNNKRKQDSQMLQDYRKALMEQVDKSCEKAEQSLFGVYESQSTSVQAKIQELFETLDRIGKIENELVQFKQALGILYEDMAQ